MHAVECMQVCLFSTLKQGLCQREFDQGEATAVSSGVSIECNNLEKNAHTPTQAGHW